MLRDWCLRFLDGVYRGGHGSLERARPRGFRGGWALGNGGLGRPGRVVLVLEGKL